MCEKFQGSAEKQGACQFKGNMEARPSGDQGRAETGVPLCLKEWELEP